MKHIRTLTQDAPKAAAAWQDIVCEINDTIAAFLDAKGGSQPFVDVLSNKCNPTPSS